MQTPPVLQSQSQTLLPFAAEDVLDRVPAIQAELMRHSLGMEPGLWDEMRHGDAGLRASWREFVHWMPLPAPPSEQP